jgi:hypothetical protein
MWMSSLDSIMHNVDMQDFRNLAHLVHNPRRDLMYHTRSMNPRRDNRYQCTYSRDRNRRT